MFIYSSSSSSSSSVAEHTDNWDQFGSELLLLLLCYSTFFLKRACAPRHSFKSAKR